MSTVQAKKYVIPRRHTYAPAQTVYIAPQATQPEIVGIDPILQYIKHNTPAKVQVMIQNTNGKSALIGGESTTGWPLQTTPSRRHSALLGETDCSASA